MNRREQHQRDDEPVRDDSGVGERPDRMIPVSGEESQLQNTSEDVDERDAARTREHVRERDLSPARPPSDKA